MFIEEEKARLYLSGYSEFVDAVDRYLVFRCKHDEEWNIAEGSVAVWGDTVEIHWEETWSYGGYDSGVESFNMSDLWTPENELRLRWSKEAQAEALRQEERKDREKREQIRWHKEQLAKLTDV